MPGSSVRDVVAVSTTARRTLCPYFLHPLLQELPVLLTNINKRAPADKVDQLRAHYTKQAAIGRKIGS
jgi:hypothetical protein